MCIKPDKTRSNVFLVLGIAGVLIGISSGCEQFKRATGKQLKSKNGSRIVVAQPSSECLECHAEIYADWKNSDHANANREYTREGFGDAFAGHRYLPVGGEVSEFYLEKGKPVLKTTGPDGNSRNYTPEMVLANNPMVQFLIPFPGGRWQVSELAWDVHKNEWFNVFGDEQRKPDEWGHWSQRGMNWNAQCGICHTSFYEKNYDMETDSYRSRWDEMGISCQQCHGKMPEHLAHPDIPVVDAEKLDADTYHQSCYSCHSRREDLTGDFRPGDKFADHYRLQLPNHEQYYFPDGQIKDEVFVYGSFLMSKMYEKGVRCLDCHDPHSLRLKLPVENNELCMVCHRTPGVNDAIPIDPLQHGHHAEGSIGNRCVECHMPARTYMSRDPRRDHGFHTPDPLMTEKYGVPNACVACHDSEGADWVIQSFEDWYGESENLRIKRRHTSVVAAAFQGDETIKDDLFSILENESSPAWKAAFIQMLLNLNSSEKTIFRLVPYLKDPSPMVRDAVVQVFSGFPGFENIVRPMLKDRSRLVRVDAAWYLRTEIDGDSVVDRELLQYMDYAGDQPAGALRWATYHADRGEIDLAQPWLDKLVTWDQSSWEAWIARGVLLNQLGQLNEAIDSFEQAHLKNPGEVTPLFYQAMLLAEQGNIQEAKMKFEQIVRLDPSFDRAWYNLGLILSQEGSDGGAISYLEQAISINPNEPDYLYAKATILLRLNSVDSAQKVIDKILLIAPEHESANQLKRMLESNFR